LRDSLLSGLIFPMADCGKSSHGENERRRHVLFLKDDLALRGRTETGAAVARNDSGDTVLAEGAQDRLFDGQNQGRRTLVESGQNGRMPMKMAADSEVARLKTGIHAAFCRSVFGRFEPAGIGGADSASVRHLCRSPLSR
jgi:hypothetical protein